MRTCATWLRQPSTFNAGFWYCLKVRYYRDFGEPLPRYPDYRMHWPPNIVRPEGKQKPRPVRRPTGRTTETEPLDSRQASTQDAARPHAIVGTVEAALKFAAGQYPIRVIPKQNIKSGVTGKKDSHIHGYRTTVSNDAELTTFVETGVKLSPVGLIYLVKTGKTAGT